MAVLLENDAAGLVHGVQPANGAATGGASGDAFQTVAPGTGCVLEGSNAHPISGGMGVHMFAASGQGCYLEWAPSSEAQDSYAARCGVIMDTTGAATTDQAVIQIRSTSGTMASLVVDPDAGTGAVADRFKMVNAIGADAVTGAIDIPWAFTARIFPEFWVTKGTTTSNGSAQFRWWIGGTLQETVNTRANATSTVGSYNTGIVQASRCRFGRATTPASTCEMWMGTFALQTAASGYIGLPAVSPPTLNILTGVRYMISLSTSTPGGSGLLEYAASRTSGPVTEIAVKNIGEYLVTQHATDEIVVAVETTEPGNGTVAGSVTVPPLAVGTSPDGQTEVLIYDGTTWG